uniref:PEHE domain-containing protein n=1 Tax=Panagrellus redivivus TaxID=6233 RepID=A0A7E4ZY03_PANRE
MFKKSLLKPRRSNTPSTVHAHVDDVMDDNLFSSRRRTACCRVSLQRRSRRAKCHCDSGGCCMLREDGGDQARLGRKQDGEKTGVEWKNLKVRDLLHAVGKKCGIDPHVIDNLDLENVVERTIAINEGKEPPADTNDDPPAPPQEPQPTRDENDNISMKPPSEACPLLSRTSVRSKLSTISMPRRDLVIQNPTIMTPSISESPMEIYIPPMFSEHEIAAIDMDDPEEEPVMYFVNPIVATHYSPLVVPPQSDIAMPADLAPAAPIMVFEDAEAIKQMRRNTLSRTPSPDASSLEPKKFKEKREKYGRDPRKLYETYQEEWDRLERLSDRRLGPRRKSVLSPSMMPHATSLHGSTYLHHRDQDSPEPKGDTQ